MYHKNTELAYKFYKLAIDQGLETRCAEIKAALSRAHVLRARPSSRRCTRTRRCERCRVVFLLPRRVSQRAH